MLPDVVLHYICPVWELVWALLFWLPIIILDRSMRAHDKWAGVKFVLCFFFFVLFYVTSPDLGLPKYCCGDYYTKSAIRAHKLYVYFWGALFLGPVLWVLVVRFIRAKRTLYRFMSDSVADGCLRAVFERKEGEHCHAWLSAAAEEKTYRWVFHDMRQKSDRDVQYLARCATHGYTDTPVCMVFSIPVEEVLLRLERYGLAKKGHERLPAANFLSRKLPPPGGAVLQFASDAEYVRVWG